MEHPASTEKKNERATSQPETTEAPLYEITFSTVLVSLHTAACYHLGMLPYPDIQNASKNLVMAKQTIDTILMLKEKTTGNLTPQEAALIKKILYELEMHYVEEQQKAGQR